MTDPLPEPPPNSSPNLQYVLDKGFVDLKDVMGDDLTVVNAARVSFSKESEWDFDLETSIPFLQEKDAKLINYLAKHNHWTPFGHPQITLHFKMPIFVARQFMRSNVGIVYNEVSRRYVDDEPEFYEPGYEWRKRPEKSIKQGSGELLDTDYGLYTNTIVQCYNTYHYLLSQGVAPEMARMVLPLSTYTEFWATFSLAALARVCKLRSDSHAQKEIQEYAKAIDAIVRPLFPVSWQALLNDSVPLPNV